MEMMQIKNNDIDNSTFQRLFVDFIFPHYDKWSKTGQEKPVAEFAIDLFLKLDESKHHEYRRFLSLLLSRPESSYSISTWRLFLFFMLDFTKQSIDNPTDSFWEWDSVKLLQFLTQKEFLIGFGELLHPFDSQEIDGALKSFIKALKRTKMTSFDLVESVQKFSEFFTRWYMGTSPSSLNQTPRIYRVEKSLQTLVSKNRPIQYYQSVNQLLEKIDDNLVNFSNNPSASLSSELNPLIDFMVVNMLNLMHLYQDHFRKTQKELPEDYGRELIASFGNFLDQKK